MYLLGIIRTERSSIKINAPPEIKTAQVPRSNVHDLATGLIAPRGIATPSRLPYLPVSVRHHQSCAPLGPHVRVLMSQLADWPETQHPH
jgi:hypothetical protein